MDIRNFFKRQDNKQIVALQEKLSSLEQTINKSRLNDSLVGIIGNQWLELTPTEENTYSSHYTIYKGIDLLADSLAQLPLRIYRGDEVMPLDFVLPGGFDLQNPHPEISLNELIYKSAVYFFYRGEFMVYIDLEKFMTLEPVNPKLMIKQPDGNWRWDNTKAIPKEQLIYAPLFNPDANYLKGAYDTDRGISPVDVVKSELMNDIGARDYATKFFQNFAQLGGTLYDEEGRATMDDMTKVVDEFNRYHASKSNAHKTVGLPKGIKYESMAQTMVEMQFLESRKDIRDKILSVLGIHKALFGITDQVNRSVAEEATRQLWEFNLKPKAIRIQEKINQSLFRKYFPAYRCYFDFSGIEALKENKEAILLQAKGYRDLGYTLNEINDYFDLGMDEITDPVGNMRFVPNSLIPVDDLLIEVDPLPPAKNKIDNLLDKAVDILEIEYKTTSIDKRVSSYVNRFNVLERKTEKQFTGKISKYLSVQLNKVMAVVNARKSVSGSIDKDIDLNTLLADIQNTINNDKERLATTTKPVYVDAWLSADALAISVVASDKAPNVDMAIIDSMTNKIKTINNTIYRKLRDQMKESLDAGESLDQMATRIKDVYKFTSSKARTIARTESGTVLNRSTDKRYTEEGVQKKRWLSAGDGLVRETHMANDSAGVVPYDYVYSGGMRYPHDPAGNAADVINCRCCLIPIIE